MKSNNNGTDRERGDESDDEEGTSGSLPEHPSKAQVSNKNKVKTTAPTEDSCSYIGYAQVEFVNGGGSEEEVTEGPSPARIAISSERFLVSSTSSAAEAAQQDNNGRDIALPLSQLLLPQTEVYNGNGLRLSFRDLIIRFKNPQELEHAAKNLSNRLVRFRELQGQKYYHETCKLKKEIVPDQSNHHLSDIGAALVASRTTIDDAGISPPPETVLRRSLPGEFTAGAGRTQRRQSSKHAALEIEPSNKAPPTMIHPGAYSVKPAPLAGAPDTSSAADEDQNVNDNERTEIQSQEAAELEVTQLLREVTKQRQESFRDLHQQEHELATMSLSAFEEDQDSDTDKPDFNNDDPAFRFLVNHNRSSEHQLQLQHQEQSLQSDAEAPLSSETWLERMGVTTVIRGGVNVHQQSGPSLVPESEHNDEEELHVHGHQHQYGNPHGSEDSVENDNVLIEATLVGNGNNPNTRNGAQEQSTYSEPTLLVEAKAMGFFSSYKMLTVGVLLLGITIFLGLGFSFIWNQESPPSEDETQYPTMAPSLSPTSTPMPTLQKISEEGVLRCGVFHSSIDFYAGKEEWNVTINDTFMTSELCRALAAATLGPNYMFELVGTNINDAYGFLSNRSIDVLLSKPAGAMEDDIYQRDTMKGYAFSTPFLYDGLAFAGLPKFVACTEDDIKTFFECVDIKICVTDNSRYMDLLLQRIPRRFILPLANSLEIDNAFIQGDCNVMAKHSSLLAEVKVRALGYSGEYVRGEKLYGKDVYAFATLENDAEWTKFANNILMALLAAEQQGISQSNADEFMETDLFGEEYRDCFIDAIRAIGNYGDLYHRTITAYWPRTELNTINNGTTGLMYSLPYGPLAGVEGPDLTSQDGTVARIVQRGHLICGVRPNRPGFAENNTADGSIGGIDVDYCRALSASLFSGENSIVMKEVTNQSTGFQWLSEGSIDVFAGGTWSLQNEVREATTGDHFSFSMPYFYSPVPAGRDGENAITSSYDENLCLVTRMDDASWSSFVAWLVSATVYAEEEGITQRFSNSMPEVYLFGVSFRRFFRDAVHAVGNYGEIYQRNLSPVLPRSGRNNLNDFENPGPQHFVIPGFS